MPLTKHHGLGNDFLVLLDLDGTRPVRRRPPSRSATAAPGIGADGLLRATRRHRRRRRHHGAAQRRRLPGRDERQRHPLPRPGGVPGRRWPCRPCSGWPPTPACARSPSSPRTATDAAPHERRDGAGQGRRRRTGVGRRRRGRRHPRVDVGNPHLVLVGRRPSSRRATTLVAIGARIDGAVAGGANVEIVRPGRGRPASTWSCTSAVSASPRPAAPAPARSAAAAHEWGIVRRARSPCTCRAAPVAIDARRPGPRSPATPPPSPSIDDAVAVTAREASVSLIERTFREKIVLVGVTLPPTPPRTPRPALDELAAARRHRRGRRGRGASCSAAHAPDPRHLHRQGQGRGAPRDRPRDRLRHRGLRQRAHARPSSATSRSCSAARPSTAPR